MQIFSRIKFLLAQFANGPQALALHLIMRVQNPVCVLASFVCALGAFAQSKTPPPADATTDGSGQPVQLEAFTVTGSNIRRVDAETALPVTVFDKSDLDARGASTMSELFETLGAADISGITEINNGPQL